MRENILYISLLLKALHEYMGTFFSQKGKNPSELQENQNVSFATSQESLEHLMALGGSNNGKYRMKVLCSVLLKNMENLWPYRHLHIYTPFLHP